MTETKSRVRFFERLLHAQDRITPPSGLKMALHLLCSLLFGLELTLAGTLVTLQSGRLTLAWVTGHVPAVLAAALGIGLLTAFFGFLFRSLFFGSIVAAAAAMLLAFVNHYKLLITEEPLRLQDFGLIGKLGSIADLNSDYIRLSRNGARALAATALCLLAIAFLSRPLRLRFRRSLPAAALSLAALALAFGVFADRLVYTPLGAPLSGLYGQTHVNGLCGAPLGIWRDALSRLKSKALRDYSEEGMLNTLSAAEDYAAAEGISAAAGAGQPNIILILSESFFDVTALPGVSYEEDPLGNFHRLQTEGVSGVFHTRSLGYGTCNIELEILTGLNTALFPERTDLCYLGGDELSRIDPIPALLRENGYYTAMLHTFNDSIYNRTPLMTAIGFDDLYFSDGFAAVDDEAAAAEDYWDYMDGKISGMFYSDDYLTDLLIDLYEKKTADAPVFLYGISMENHSPYNGKKYGGVCDYPADAPALDTEALAALNSAAQGISGADRALGKLTDYFSDCGEATVIIFFGDHRPGLGLPGGGSVYDALDMPAAGTLERYGTLYETNYLIWSNDPSLLPAEPGSTASESSDYLGLQILNAAHIPDTVYWGLVRSLSEVSLMYTPEYYISAGGTLSAAPSWKSGEEDRFSRMKDIVYDAFYGKQYITQALNAPAAG